jgi:hypothetical protein
MGYRIDACVRLNPSASRQLARRRIRARVRIAEAELARDLWVARDNDSNPNAFGLKTV